MQRIFINKCFLFTMGSVYRVKRFTTGSRKSRGRSKVADDARPSAEVAETTVEGLLCCGFRHAGKRRDKCICGGGGGYVEKLCFQIRI
jgi:hypothetical protein